MFYYSDGAPPGVQPWGRHWGGGRGHALSRRRGGRAAPCLIQIQAWEVARDFTQETYAPSGPGVIVSSCHNDAALQSDLNQRHEVAGTSNNVHAQDEVVQPIWSGFWRRKWKPTAAFLPGKSHGQRSLVGYTPWGRTYSDVTQHSTAVWIQLGSPASGKRPSGLDSRLGVGLGSPRRVSALGRGLRRWWLMLLQWIIKAQGKKCKPGKYSQGIVPIMSTLFS